MVFVSMMQTYKLICCCCPNDATNHMNSYGWWSECSKINNIFLMFLSEWCSTQWIHMVLFVRMVQIVNIIRTIICISRCRMNHIHKMPNNINIGNNNKHNTDNKHNHKHITTTTRIVSSAGCTLAVYVKIHEWYRHRQFEGAPSSARGSSFRPNHPSARLGPYCEGRQTSCLSFNICGQTITQKEAATSHWNGVQFLRYCLTPPSIAS